MSQLISNLRALTVRAARWMFTPQDSFCLACVCLSGFALIGGWLLVQSRPAGLVPLDQVQPMPVTFRLDVNRAAWPELAQLPGIGQRLAQRIVESRQVDGPFRSVDDLQRVPGIGPKTIARVGEYFSTPHALAADEVASR